MTVNLYAFSRDGATLATGVDAIAVTRPLIGWCATPRRLLCVSVDQTGWHDHLGDPIGEVDITQVYEACLFQPEADPVDDGAPLTAGGELRWLRDPRTDGGGRAAWLAETDWCPPGFAPLPPLTDLAVIDRLTTPAGPVPNRILTQTRARLPGVPAGVRAAWRLREYIGPAPAPAGDHGNRIIVARRLIGLAPLPTENTRHD